MSDLEADIVNRLRESSRYLTGQELAAACGAGPIEIAGLIADLRLRGYRIDDVPGEGYRLVASPDLVTGAEIRAALAGRLLGRQVSAHAGVGSTNDVALALARQGAPEGTLVVAEAQTAGRGRLGRSWESRPGLGLWFSVVLRPDIEARRSCVISLIAALGVALTLRDRYGIPAAVKWPNDVMVRRSKICGILAEGEFKEGKVGAVVLGVGLNVGHGRDDFTQGLGTGATSIKLETGRGPRRVEVLADVLAAIEGQYLRLGREGFGNQRRELIGLSSLIGHVVRVATGEWEVEGTAIDIGDDGALVLRTDSGHLRSIVAGDVTQITWHESGGRNP
jgi:BirA family biotin operon repressor/biotin-[acetyl-CoA-carboxylase] ligase